MKTNQIRESFLEYFNSKGHEIVPSSSLIPNNDETLLFTNAGMVQFKDVFLGTESKNFTRATTSQRCIRAGGKHNDLENVGYTLRHHTFFEMLGNFSFGDYFKEDAIKYAWEFLTEVLKLDKDKLWITVYKDDDEAEEIWKNIIGVDASRIARLGDEDNFWSMGDTGPCGPCSEIHVDLRSNLEKEKIKGADLVNKDHPHVVEIWNLVFIQFDRQKDGSLKKLDKQYVDTGMGLERLCMALQGKNSTYETDFFTDIIKEIENISGKKYLEGDKNVDIGIRVVSDHLRAIIFTILDGQIPSNTGSGYVIRRILRRAIRYGYTNLDIHEPFMFKLVNKVTEKYDDIYPSLKAQQKYIESIIKDEEKGFLKTLNQGLNLINELIH